MLRWINHLLCQTQQTHFNSQSPTGRRPNSGVANPWPWGAQVQQYYVRTWYTLLRAKYVKLHQSHLHDSARHLYVLVHAPRSRIGWKAPRPRPYQANHRPPNLRPFVKLLWLLVTPRFRSNSHFRGKLPSAGEEFMYMILIFCVTDNHDSHSLDRTTEVLRSAYLRDCMSVCLCAYVNNQNPKEPNFRCIFHVAQSSFDSTGVHNVLPVRWISSYLLIIGQIKTTLTPGILCESPGAAPRRG